MSTDVAIRPATGGNTPTLVNTLERDAAAATELARFVREQGLSETIQGRQYLTAEAWSAAGRLLGLQIVCEDPKPFTGMEGARGYSCKARLLDANGQQISEASAICLRGEKRWMHADEFQLYSMAQTRASGKAHRMALSALAKLAGFEAASVEEMDVDVATKQPGEGMPDSTEPMPTRRIGKSEQRALADAAADAGVLAAEVKQHLQATYGIARSGELSEPQAVEVLEWIKARGMNEIPEPEEPAEDVTGQGELLDPDEAA